MNCAWCDSTEKQLMHESKLCRRCYYETVNMLAKQENLMPDPEDE